MKEIFDTIWNDPFCRTYAPYIIIAFVLGIVLLFKLGDRRQRDYGLIIKIIGFIIGIIIVYCIIWYWNQTTVQP